MLDWWLLLTPLLVLPIFLLFRFVGCGTVFGLDHITGYNDKVLEEPSLVAFWTLEDKNNDPRAEDRKGQHHGRYGQPPPSAASGVSQAATGEIHQGETVPLHGGLSVNFQGGYVSVPFAPALNTPSFTVEAWVEPGDNWEPNFAHAVLVSAEDGAAQRGFSLYSAWYPDQQSYWTVALGTGTTFVTIQGPAVVMPPVQTYLALTFDSNTDEATISVGRYGNWDDVTHAQVGGYAPAQQNNLYIGGGSNTLPPAPPPPPPPQPASPITVPFLGRIQQVAYYNAVLAGSTLEDHRDR